MQHVKIAISPGGRNEDDQSTCYTNSLLTPEEREGSNETAKTYKRRTAFIAIVFMCSGALAICIGAITYQDDAKPATVVPGPQFLETAGEHFVISTGIADWKLNGEPAPRTGSHRRWVSPPAGTSWLGSNVHDPNRTTYTLSFTLSAAQARCAHIAGQIAADDTGSFAANDVYFIGGNSSGVGTYRSLTTISDQPVFREGVNVLSMTNFNTGGGPGGVLVVGTISYICTAPIDITTGIADWKLNGAPAPRTGLAGGWVSPPAGASWLGNNVHDPPRTTFTFTFMLSVAQARCAHIEGQIAADDTGSFAANDVYFIGGNSSGVGTYRSLTTISDRAVFREGANVLSMTNFNTGGGPGGILVVGNITFNC